MAGEPEETLPDELQRWVDEQVAASDDEPADVISRAVTLYRLVEEHAASAGGETPPVGDIESDLERLADRVSTLDDRVGNVENGLDDRVGAVEDDFDEKITDIRERVIQVKREADAKAPSDHDHEELRERVESLGTRVDHGFENYEEVLSYLTDETDDLDDKVGRLAGVVVSLRKRTARAERQVTRLDAAADLKRVANRHGTTKAKCEECGGSVAIGLLTEPTCPHCESGFVGVEPAGRLFGSGTLVTGRPPALMAGDDPAEASGNGHGRRQHEGENGDGENAHADGAAELMEGSRND
ncbi:CopG family transcriptional regulator [Salinigranum rubrum]|uniref:CopG family transcriptional regulator n=1 Tax=Salinigranum rubrum TaxID=755307 RepID=A0A2I8VM75_9EURY|nr:CopG family transcriptional regulator [Salinigranum rubrum]AUV82995.1 CopG family transcriptional regulator [Salinigranum rubrum]